jgi:chitinase
MNRKSEYAINFANWDYSVRYPKPSGESDEPLSMADMKEPQVNKTTDPFSWSLDANGQITAHIIPKVTFGIVFDSSAISNAAASAPKILRLPNTNNGAD